MEVVVELLRRLVDFVIEMRRTVERLAARPGMEVAATALERDGARLAARAAQAPADFFGEMTELALDGFRVVQVLRIRDFAADGFLRAARRDDAVVVAEAQRAQLLRRLFTEVLAELHG